MNQKILDKLFKLAFKSYSKDEFPVSAIIFDDNGIISTGYNKRHRSNLTTDHAEIIAITKANKKLRNWNLQNKCMVVTLEPCHMCLEVIKEARISKVYYLIPRYSFKKAYRFTDIEHLNVNSDDLDKYEQIIKGFFINKR